MHIPQHIRVKKEPSALELVYPEGEFLLSAEYLRVHSPSAQVRGHGAGQAVLQHGKAAVTITAVAPVGNYALKITFDDGHDSGLYDWEYLYRLGRDYATMWPDYLARLAAAGLTREN